MFNWGVRVVRFNIIGILPSVFNKTTVTGFLLLGAITITPAQTATLGGTVSDLQDAGVSGCSVELVNQNKQTTTSGTGAYQFAALPIKLIDNTPRHKNGRVDGHLINFNLRIKGQISLDAYLPGGKWVKTLYQTRAEAGHYSLSLPGLVNLNTSLYILKLKVPGEVITYTYFHNSGNPFLQRAQSSIDNSGRFHKMATSAADTLKVTCTGMVPKTIPISTYDNTSMDVSVRPPNFVLVFLDDVGYGDFGKFGAEGWVTPEIDKMADEGVMFTDFYVAQAVCGASRAALLTGTLSNRINMLGAPGPNANFGIHEDELLIPELMKQKNYATAMFGKWHLGDRQQYLPIHHGFDEYFGLPYSNDMWPYHPVSPDNWAPLPLIEGDEVINPAVDSAVQRTLTKAYTERSVDFINRSADGPFFLYLAHSMAHVPLFTSPEFEGVSEQGAYGDVMMEIDWSLGEVLKALKANNIDSSTFVMITSDNGPWRLYGNHAGTTGILGPNRAKGTMFEGGARVPCVMRWPGQIPPGTKVSIPAMTVDMLPTFAKLMDGQLSSNIIDGKDIWPLIASEPGASSPHEAYYLYYGNTLNAVRKDNWKLHFPHGYREVTSEGMDGQAGTYKYPNIEWELYNLDTDIIERVDVSNSNQAIFDELQDLGNQFNNELNQNKRPRG